MEHTPVPWFVDDAAYLDHLQIAVSTDRGPLRICLLPASPELIPQSANNVRAHANAEFIVRACNAHDELLEACETLLADVEAHERRTGTPQWASSIDKARDAIAEATKGAS